jgi:hypothetical protein
MHYSEVHVATASAVSGPNRLLHTKGNWSPRDDRIASAVWLAILWAGMIAGFGVDVPRYLRENPPAPKIVHIHAVIFSTWMLILTAQILLVLRDRVSLHRKLGWLAAGWACLMAVLGPWAVMDSLALNLGLPNGDPPFLSVNIVDLAGFLILLAWGFALRKNPAAHRRMMILSTVSLADPGFSRFDFVFLPNGPTSIVGWFFWIFYGNFFLILLMLAWDFWKKRLMKSFVVAASGLLAAEFAASCIYFYKPWIAITTNWVQAWAKLHI